MTKPGGSREQRELLIALDDFLKTLVDGMLQEVVKDPALTSMTPETCMRMALEQGLTAGIVLAVVHEHSARPFMQAYVDVHGWGTIDATNRLASMLCGLIAHQLGLTFSEPDPAKVVPFGRKNLKKPRVD